ncbi:MAG: hypothetical protein JJ975_07565, partial [Bacteroidia bacterium]|nr:hypothetical protein [Bacteroidia bacterium]
LTLFLGYGCDRDPALLDRENCDQSFSLGDTIDLRFGERQCDPSENIAIEFTSFLDGRCPFGVLCITEGNAEVSLEFATTHGERDIVLNTSKANDLKRRILMDNYFVELVELNPLQPNGIKTPPSSYSAKIFIDKKKP